MAERGYRRALIDLQVPEDTLKSARQHGVEARGWARRPGERCFARLGENRVDDADQSADTYLDSDITGRVPMGRFALADDIARSIAFLADERESGFVNGHTLAVDGGWTADGSWESLRLRHR